MKSLLAKKAARQTIALFLAQTANVLLGVAVAALNARALTVEEYGAFSFALVVIIFVAWFFDFGLFAAGSRIVALAREKTEERKIVGTLIVLSLGLGVSFSAVLLVVSLFVDSVFRSNIGVVLLSLSPLVAVFPFQSMFVATLRGSNEIGKLAAYTILPRLFYLGAIFVVVKLSALTLTITLMLNVATLIAATIIIAVASRPIFWDWRNQVGRIFAETRQYGLHIYSGTIVDNLTFGSDKLLISYFLGTVAVGFYSVAQTLTMPISLMSRSLAASVFKDFTLHDKIPVRLNLANFLWLLVAGVGLLFLSKLLIERIFTEKYLSALEVVPYLTVAAVFTGLNQLYHSFLMAHRQGQFVRNMSIASSSLNVIGNVVLIYRFGIIGAALSAILTYALNYVMNLYYYQKTVNALMTVQV
ncbi:MAG: oligosaccharide flippase family protein [Bacteroidota bacterium]